MGMIRNNKTKKEEDEEIISEPRFDIQDIEHEMESQNTL